MSDTLFVLALVVPPLAVVVSLAALAMPARHETRAAGYHRAPGR